MAVTCTSRKRSKFFILNKMLIGSDRVFGNQFSLGCSSQGHSAIPEHPRTVLSLRLFVCFCTIWNLIDLRLHWNDRAFHSYILTAIIHQHRENLSVPLTPDKWGIEVGVRFNFLLQSHAIRLIWVWWMWSYFFIYLLNSSVRYGVKYKKINGNFWVFYTVYQVVREK